jgi:hypothetical protein
LRRTRLALACPAVICRRAPKFALARVSLLARCRDEWEWGGESLTCWLELRDGGLVSRKKGSRSAGLESRCRPLSPGQWAQVDSPWRLPCSQSIYIGSGSVGTALGGQVGRQGGFSSLRSGFRACHEAESLAGGLLFPGHFCRLGCFAVGLDRQCCEIGRRLEGLDDFVRT